MSQDPDQILSYPVPLTWWPSRTRSFLEVPVDHPLIHSIELQSLESNGNAGHIVELHLRSGELEIYAEPQLGLDEHWFRSDPPFAHFALKALSDTNFDRVRCEVTPGSIDGAASFIDQRGDRIELNVSLRGGRPSKPLFTPAPVHDEPNNLRFLVMNEFRMLPTRQSDVSIAVSGESVSPTPFLTPGGGPSPMLSARAGADFLLVGLNPNHQQKPLPVVGAGTSIIDDRDGVTTSVTINESTRMLTTLRAENNHAWLEATFEPGVPNLEDIVESGSSHGGILTVTSPVGTVCSGRWNAWPVGDNVAFDLSGLSQDWSAGFRQPARVALRYIRSHRRRHQRWAHRAGITAQDGKWISTGQWSSR